MLQIRKMTGADAKTVLPMVYGFYRSDAVITQCRKKP